MSEIQLKDGDLVLIRGRLVEGRLRLEDGTEVARGAVGIVAELPEPIAGLPHSLLLFFETEDDRRAFAEMFEGAGCVEL